MSVCGTALAECCEVAEREREAEGFALKCSFGTIFTLRGKQLTNSRHWKRCGVQQSITGCQAERQIRLALWNTLEQQIKSEDGLFFILRHEKVRKHNLTQNKKVTNIFFFPICSWTYAMNYQQFTEYLLK